MLDIYGINSDKPSEIANFKKLTDYLNKDETRDLYNSLTENVVDYGMTNSGLYILTDENDNNSLYVCTQKNIEFSGLPLESERGFEELDNYNIPIKILDNVKYIRTASTNKFALTFDNKLYCWGWNDGYSLGMNASNVPSLYTGNEIKPSQIVEIFPQSYQTYITQSADNNGQTFWVTGINHVNGATGLDKTFNTWSEFGLNLLGNEHVQSVVSSNMISDYLVLTDKGNLYAWGRANMIGIGRSDSEIIRNVRKIDTMSDVVQITGGNGFFVAIKKDGSVWGTGSNMSGILGRWIGIDRTSPNSRYKTAFDWVECPELEL